MSARNRNSILARIRKTGAALATLGSRTVALTWQLAEECVALRATFPQGSEGMAAFVASAATASGKGEATIRNLVRAVEIRDSLTQAQREKVAGWSYDMVLALAKGTASERTRTIQKVEKVGSRSPVEVRKVHRTSTGGTKRAGRSSAEQTSKLAEKVRAEVEKLLSNGHDPVSLAAGARLAREYTGDVASAILFVAANVRTAAKVAA